MSGDFTGIVMDRHIVLVTRRPRSKWWKVKCFCPPSSRRKDGTCKHERSVFDMLKPEIKQRAHIESQTKRRATT